MMDDRMVEYYIDRPVEFAVDMLGVSPEPYQRDVMQSVAKNARTSVRSGHGVGKTALQAWLILWFLCTRPYPKIPCTAPTKHQLYDILWAEAAHWLRKSKLKDDVVWSKEKIYLKGYGEDWFAVPRTATSPDALQGFHAEHLFYIIDEASGVPDEIFEPVLGSLSTPDAKLLMCGNPTRISGFFFDSHQKSKRMYETFQISSEGAARVSREYVETVAELFGRESDVFRVRVLGKFPKAMPDSFIPMDWAERNVEQTNPKMARRVDIGVDVARYGDDESVVCVVLDGAHTLPLRVFRKLDTMELAGRVAQQIEQVKGEYPDARVRVKVDCDGLGVGVHDRLRELHLPCELMEGHFGGRGGRVAPDDPVEMANSTGLMWGRIRGLLKENRLKLPSDDVLVSQLCNRRYWVRSDGKIEMERKSDMKERGASSPDRADALCLALYEPVGSGFVRINI